MSQYVALIDREACNTKILDVNETYSNKHIKIELLQILMSFSVAPDVLPFQAISIFYRNMSCQFEAAAC